MTVTEFPGQRQNILGNFVDILRERQKEILSPCLATKFSVTLALWNHVRVVMPLVQVVL